MKHGGQKSLLANKTALFACHAPGVTDIIAHSIFHPLPNKARGVDVSAAPQPGLNTESASCTQVLLNNTSQLDRN